MEILINTILSTITGSLIGYIITKVKIMKKEDADIKDAVTSLLRSDITNYYYRCVGRNYIRQWEKQNIYYLYESYKKLGGNSYVEIIMEHIDELPVKK